MTTADRVSRDDDETNNNSAINSNDANANNNNNQSHGVDDEKNTSSGSNSSGMSKTMTNSNAVVMPFKEHRDGHLSSTMSSLRENLLSSSSPPPPRVITTTTHITSSHSSSSSFKNYWMAASPISLADDHWHDEPPHSSSSSTPSSLTRAQRINAKLRLNLGLSFLLQPNHTGVRRCMAWLDAILFAWYEQVLFALWKHTLPLVLRQGLAWNLWKYFFLPLHKMVLGKSTGIHASASYEFHALTSLMYFGRLVPNTVARMRFALSQICVIARPIQKVNVMATTTASSTTKSTSSTAPFDWDQYMEMITKTTTTTSPYSTRSSTTATTATPSCHVEEVMYDMRDNLLQQLTVSQDESHNGNYYDQQEILQDLLSINPTVVQGTYVHVKDDDNNNNNNNDDHTTDTTRPVILWFYGGAFLAGDVKGNLEHAKYVGMAVGCHVFVPHYRLVPQVHLDDQIWDTTLAYRYLITVRKIPPTRIILWGISSGAGLALRLMQNASWMLAAAAATGAAAVTKEEERESSRKQVIPSKVQPLLELSSPVSTTTTTTTSDAAPSTNTAAMGVVLLCPFVDYTEAPKGGSFLEYAQHDLIVNQSVLEVGLPYLEQVLGDHEERYKASPLYGTYPSNNKQNTKVSFPPVCVVVGEHETVYDQTMQMIQALQDNGIHVTVGVWKYMFHVFCMIYAYLPEGQEAMQFCLQWIVQQKSKKSQHDVAAI